MNVFAFTGNLGKDCETNNVSGTAVCNFNVAVKSGYGDREQTFWVRVALWGKRAETRLPEFLTKGQQVAVSGELSTRDYEGKTYLECRANDVTLVGGKSEGSAPQQQARQQAQAPAQQQTAPANNFDDFEDDIPFN